MSGSNNIELKIAANFAEVISGSSEVKRAWESAVAALSSGSESAAKTVNKSLETMAATIKVQEVLYTQFSGTVKASIGDQIAAIKMLMEALQSEMKARGQATAEAKAMAAEEKQTAREVAAAKKKETREAAAEARAAAKEAADAVKTAAAEEKQAARDAAAAKKQAAKEAAAEARAAAAAEKQAIKEITDAKRQAAKEAAAEAKAAAAAERQAAKEVNAAKKQEMREAAAEAKAAADVERQAAADAVAAKRQAAADAIAARRAENAEKKRIQEEQRSLSRQEAQELAEQRRSAAQAERERSQAIREATAILERQATAEKAAAAAGTTADEVLKKQAADASAAAAAIAKVAQQFGVSATTLGSFARVGREASDAIARMEAPADEARARIDRLRDSFVAAGAAARAAVPPVGELDKGVDELGKKTKIGSSAFQEMERMLRATMTGQFHLLAGEAMTLATRLKDVSASTYMVVGGFASAVIVGTELYNVLEKIRLNRLDMTSAAAVLNPSVTKKEAEALESSLRFRGVVPTDEIGKVGAVLINTMGAGVEQVKFLADAAQTLGPAFGGPLQAAHRFSSAISDPALAGKEMMHSLVDNLADGTARFQKFDELVGKRDYAQAKIVLFQELNSAMQRQGELSTDLVKRADQLNGALSMGAVAATGVAAPAFLTDLATGLNTDVERAKNFAAAIATVTGQVKNSAADTHNFIVLQEQLVSKNKQLKYDETIAAAGGTPSKARIAALQAEQQVWANVNQAELKDIEQVNKVKAKLAESTFQLSEAVAREQKLAAATTMQELEVAYGEDRKKNKAALLAKGVDNDTYRRSSLESEIQFYKDKMAMTGDKAPDEHLRAAMVIKMNALESQLDDELQHQKSRNAKTSLADQLAAMKDRQVAAGKDFAEVMRIEDEKLALIARSLGKQAKLYSEEQTHKRMLLAKHAEESVKIEEATLQGQLRDSKTAVQDHKMQLQTKVDNNEITQRQMIAQLLEFEREQYNSIKRSVTEFAATLTQYPVLQAQAYALIKTLDTRFHKDVSEAGKLAAEEDKRELLKKVQMWESAAGKIGGAMNNALTGMIMKTNTTQAAMKQVVTGMVSDFVSMTLSMAGKWAIMQLAMTQTSAVQNAVRTAQDKLGQTGFGALIMGMVSKFTAGEATKTSAALAGLTIRESAEIAAAETTKTVTAATNATTVMSDASKAAAGAYAAVAEIPIVGPVLAPIAAGTAFAAVSAFRMIGLDVGAWNVPKDMPAYIHQGEMVVPKNFAEGIRSNMGGGGGGGGGGGVQNFHFSPSITGSGGGSGGQTLNTQVMAAYSYFRNIGRNGAIALPGRPA